MTQFNGNFGCCRKVSYYELYIICIIMYISVTTQKLGSVHTYPYSEVNPTGPDRMHAQHHQSAIQAIESNSIVRTEVCLF